METGAREVGIGETERGRSKRGSRKKERRKGEEEKTEEGENHRNKKSSRRVGDMGRGERSGKVGGRSEEVSTGEVSQVDKGVWEEAIREDVYKKLWYHAIDVKEGFVPRKGKVYPLSREEREEVREFVKEQLRKGYIQLSKSPQTAPVFFVRKKDGKKRMVQDYRYLNE